MTTRVGGVIADFVANTASFDNNVKKAASNLNSNAAKMNKSLQSIQRSVGVVRASLEGFAAGIGVAGLVRVTKAGLDYASSLGEVADQLGVTSKELQVYRYAASQVGVSQEGIDKGLARLTLTIGKASLGAKAQSEAFEALGISVRDSSGRLKTAGDIMPELADRMAKIKDPAQRAAVTFTMFGKAGQELTRLLSGGSGEINNLAEAAEKMGLVLSDREIQQADDTADKLAALKQVLSANIARTVAQNANSILGLASALTTLTGQILKFLNSNPQLALGIIGGLAGARFGAAGAAIGVAGGVVAGDQLAKASTDANMDIGFRTAQLNAARKEMRARIAADKAGGIFSIRKGTGAGTVQSSMNEVRRQIGLLEQATAQTRAGRGSAGPGLQLDDFLASGGGKGGKSEAEKAAQQAAEAAKKLTEEYTQQTTELANQLKFQGMRAQGLDQQADIEEAIARLHEQMPTLDKARMDILEGQTRELINQEYAVKAQKDAYDKLNDALDNHKDLLKDVAEEQKRWAEEQQQQIKAFGDEIGDSFANALDGALTGRKGWAKDWVDDLSFQMRKAVILDPFKEMISSSLGQPLAKKIGIGNDPFKLSPELTAALQQSATQINTLGTAATQAANALRALPAGGVNIANPTIPDLTGAGLTVPNAIPANDNLAGLGITTQKATNTLASQIPVIAQFGSALAMAMSGGGGGGGILGSVLGIASTLIGSGAIKFGGGAGAINSFTNNTLNNMGKFKTGLLPGMAKGGRPRGLTLVGELGPELFVPDTPGTIVPASQTANYMRAMANVRPADIRGGDNYNINVTGPMTPRERRDTGEQIASVVQSRQAAARRRGIAA